MTRADHRLGREASGPGSGAALAAWLGAALFVASLGYFVYTYLVRFGAAAPAGSAARAIAIDVALFTAFALHHSALARSGAKAWVRQYMPAYVERSLYTWVSSALFIAVCYFWQPVPGILYSVAPPFAYLAYAVQIGAIWLTARGASAIDVLDLAGVRPVLLARDGVSPRHVALETRGTYGIVRHPIYLGWALLVFSAPTMTATRAVFAIVSTAYLAIAIPFEERSLVDAFGSEYRSYQQRVRWRMLPGIY